MSFFLGSFASGLAKELDSQRKARQQQQEQEFRQLQMQAYLKQLQGQQEISGLGGLGFTPPDIDIKQPTPVGGDMGDQPSSLGRSLMRSQAPLLGSNQNNPGSLAMQHTPEEQDKVAAAIATQGGAQHWANFNPTLRSDLQAAGLPTSGPVDPSQLQQFLSLVHKDESMGGQNIPNFRFDRTHTAGGVDQITNTTWKEFAPRAGVNIARMGPVDTSPQARAEGARELGILPTPAQYSGPGAGFLPQATAPQGGPPAASAPQGGPDTYNRAVQEVLRARQQVQETLRRAPNATVQQRQQVLNEWDKQAKEWLGGIKEQSNRAEADQTWRRHHEIERQEHLEDEARRLQQRPPTPGMGREKDIEKEISRLDRKYKADNPKATQDELDAAHFKNRRTAEGGLAESKAAPARTISSAIARKFLETHPDATDEDLITLYGKTRREASIQTAFAGGEPARQLRSLNTLAGHIGLLREYGEALRNRGLVAANKLLNAWSLETGHPEVTDFNEARTIAADEIVRLLTNTGGTEDDRKGMQAIWSPNASPEQLAGASNVATRFIKSRLDGLQQQYARNDPTKRQEFTDTMLSPEAKAFYSAQIPGAAEPQRPEPGAAPSGGNISQDEYGKLKPGDKFMWDGQEYTKQ